MSIIAEFVNSLIEAKKHKEAIEHLELAQLLAPLVHEPDRGEFAYIYYLECTVYLMTGDRIRLRKSAQKTIKFIDSLPDPKAKLQLLGNDSMENIRNLAKSVLEPDSFVDRSNPTVRNERKFGRNERITVSYKDGRVLERIQYKKVQADLEQGLCVIIAPK